MHQQPREMTRSSWKTGISVTTETDGQFVATVHLHGELCAATAPVLRTEMERLLEDGVTDVIFKLQDLQTCTSHGLDLWDDVHRELKDRSGGAVYLVGPHGVVERVLDLITDADPSFLPLRTSGLLPRKASAVPQ